MLKSKHIIETLMRNRAVTGFWKILNFSKCASKEKRQLNNEEEDYGQGTWVYLCLAKVVDHQHAHEVEQHAQGLERDDCQPQIFILLDEARAVISTVGAALPAGQADMGLFCSILCAPRKMVIWAPSCKFQRRPQCQSVDKVKQQLTNDRKYLQAIHLTRGWYAEHIMHSTQQQKAS